MRILHLNDVASVASTLAGAQRALGHGADLRRLRLAAGSRGLALKILAAPARALELAAVNREVAAGGYDVVHIHYAYLGLAGVLGRYPYVLHCHGTDVRQGLRDPWRRWAVVAALRGARRVIVATPDLLPVVRPVRPDAVFVPNPVDTERFRAEPMPEGPLRVLLISALTTVKRADIALEVARRVLDSVPGARVTALDTGAERDLYRAQGKGVDFIPAIPHDGMPAVIARHHVVVGQFGIGSLGMSELEAMACGRPVTCHFTAGPAYPEPPPLEATQDPEAAARWIAELAADRERLQATGAAARSWVVAQHSAAAAARRVEEIYQSATGAARTAG